MIVIASIIFLVALSLYTVFAWAIMYHIKSYAIEGDLSPTMMTIFLMLSAVLIASSLYFFLRIPWEDIPSSVERNPISSHILDI